jgi:DNA helicase-2/ATP-dependent DNA helicase PcrA
LYKPSEKYYVDVSKQLNTHKSLLIIHPDVTSIYPRKKIIGQFRTPITLIESIDDKDFYEFSKKFDSMGEADLEKTIFNICESIFNKTELKNWISEKRVINKTKENENLISLPLKEKYEAAKSSKSFSQVAEILKEIMKLPGIRCYRKELLNNLCISLKEAEFNESSVLEAMISKRNRVRKNGRKVFGRCIGTTLLTKGLEFETVIILNVNKFTCPKNLYVALTRASKNLIVFGTSKILTLNY